MFPVRSGQSRCDYTAPPPSPRQIELKCNELITQFSLKIDAREMLSIAYI